MALVVKFLERDADAWVRTDPGGNGTLKNLFASEATGYTGGSCAITHSTTDHTWTLLGNAATTTMTWYYATTRAYAADKKIHFHALVKAMSAGLSSIAFTIEGTTSGSVAVASQLSPVNGTWYTLHAQATLTGLVGNLRLKITVTDPASTNTKTVVIKDWIVMDETYEFGAGYEVSDTDMEAWYAWRGEGMEYLDHWDTFGSDPYYGLLPGVDHGADTLDAFGDPADPTSFSPLYKMDDNFLCRRAGSGALTTYLWRATDRTSRLRSGTFHADLRTDVDATVTFAVNADSAWSPKVGQTVMVYLDGSLLQTGKIVESVRKPILGAGTWTCDVTVMPLNILANRCLHSHVLHSLDFLTSKAAIMEVWDAGFGSFGILWGGVETGVADTGEVGQDYDSAAAILDALAAQAGKRWYIDNYCRLNFRDVVTTPVDAAHALVDGNGYNGYHNVEVTETAEGYASVVTAIGDGVSAIVTDQAARQQEIMDIEANSYRHDRLLRYSDMDDYDMVVSAATTYNAMYGRVMPLDISFDSPDTDWRPNTKLEVQIAGLGIPSSLYFNVESVALVDIDGIHVHSHVTASTRDPDLFANAPTAGATSYIADLQLKAQDSVGALKEESGTLTPTLYGSTGAGTWAYGTQLGKWIRQGNIVHFKLRVSPSSISGSPTGNLYIGGLPFAAEGTTNNEFAVWSSGLAWGSSDTQIMASLVAGADYLQLESLQNNATFESVPVSSISAGDQIIISGSYIIA